MHNSLLSIAKLVQTRCGLNFTTKLESLERKIQSRVKALGCDYEAYDLRLRTIADEWALLIEALTVHETYFFREEQHFEVLCNIAIPEFRKRNKTQIQIWSAACSTGEEPYSIAMSLLEHGCPLQSIQILATDIDEKTLGNAKRGWYSKKSFSFRRMSENYLDKYFNVDEDGYRLQAHIRQAVQFKQQNLIELAQERGRSLYDAIFCRNVLIYFDDVARTSVVQALYDRLNPGGYLFLGHADHLNNMPHAIETVRTANTFCYKKGEVADGIRSIGGR